MVEQMSAEAGETAVRERLLAAATELFITRGYAGTSVREIVEAAGVTKPVLYYWFKSKEGIYLELMETVRLLYDEKISSLVDFEGTSRERLHLLLVGMFDGARQNLSLVRLIYSIYFGPSQGAPPYNFNRFFDHTMELVRTLLQEGMANGEFASGDTSPATWALMGSYHTIMEEQFCRDNPRISRQGLVQVINLILDGLSASPNAERQSCPGS